MIDAFEKIINNVNKISPRVHNITSCVSAADQANITLIAGGSPIMADSAREAAEICSICDALVLNMGMLSEERLEAMLIAGKTAGKIGIPVILDPVGAGASKLRSKAVKRLLSEIKISAIHLNASELKAICDDVGNPGGVDVYGSFSSEETARLAKRLFAETGAVTAVTGKTDIICAGDKTAAVVGGCEMLKRITASGCMLSSVMGVYCGANPDDIFGAVLCASALFKTGAARAYREGIGLASYKTAFFDELTYPDTGGADIEFM